MRRNDDAMHLLLPWVALLPAILIAAWWPHTLMARLPLAVLPLYVTHQVASRGQRSPGIFAGTLLVLPVIFCSVAVLRVAAVLYSVVGLGCWALGRRRRRRRPRPRMFWEAVALQGLLLLMWGITLALVAPVGRPAAAPQDEPQSKPLVFVPLSLDAAGRQAMLFSLRDDDRDDEQLALWSLNLDSGKPQRMYLGHPFVTTDWSPTGHAVCLSASEASRGDRAQPLGVALAMADGSASRWRLAPPKDGTCWMYPLWSKQGNQLAAWLFPDVPELPLGAGPLQRVPQSFAMDVNSGEPRELKIRGARLSLFGAWQAEAAGAYMVTEHGLYLIGADGKQRKLVSAGEAPFDPFPFAVPEGVCPAGGWLAYLEMTIRNGEIARIDLSLVDAKGKHRRVVPDLYPVAFGWTPDGKVLAGAQVLKGERVGVLVHDAASGKTKALQTGLKLASREFPIRLTASPDGRWLALDGQFVDRDSWSVAVVDLAKGQTKLLPEAANLLAVGWRHDNKLVVSDLGGVGVVCPESGRLEPIFPASADKNHSQPWAVKLLGHLRGMQGLAREHEAARLLARAVPATPR
ncbi:MAG: hypothetical protein HYU66_03230 [Armatimonadetes bacterium]|nr:hypothetical protein [Armatimonadota bacterium]